MATDMIPLVVVVDRGLTWAVYAADVREIVDAVGWRGAPPVDVVGLWGGKLADAFQSAKEASPASRALVVRTRIGERALLSPRVSFRTIERSRVLPLPDVFALARGAAMVAGVVFGGSDEQLVVLKPDGFVDQNFPLPDVVPATTSLKLTRGITG